MNDDRLVSLLNEAWKLIEPKPIYDEVNSKFTVKDIAALEALESVNPSLGLSDHGMGGGVKGLTWISLLATITDELCGKRLAAIVEADGTISGWCWHRHTAPTNTEDRRI